MTDGIDETDVERVDQHVDPTATTRDEIEESLNDDFEGDSREAFADALAEQRAPVRDEARQLLSKRLTRNPASGDIQLRNSKGQFASGVSDVRGTRVDDSGTVVAETDAGSVELGTVDLDAGASGGRDAEYSP